jgi:hypothetical protein
LKAWIKSKVVKDLYCIATVWMEAPKSKKAWSRTLVL